MEPNQETCQDMEEIMREKETHLIIGQDMDQDLTRGLMEEMKLTRTDTDVNHKGTTHTIRLQDIDQDLKKQTAGMTQGTTGTDQKAKTEEMAVKLHTT